MTKELLVQAYKGLEDWERKHPGELIGDRVQHMMRELSGIETCPLGDGSGEQPFPEPMIRGNLQAQILNENFKRMLESRNHWMDRALVAETEIKRLSEILEKANPPAPLGAFTISECATPPEFTAGSYSAPISADIDWEIERAMADERMRARKK